jgi:hypothetical protein
MSRTTLIKALCLLSLVLLGAATARASDSSRSSNSGSDHHPRLTKSITLTSKPHNPQIHHQNQNESGKSELRNAIGEPVVQPGHERGERPDIPHPTSNGMPQFNKNTASGGLAKGNSDLTRPAPWRPRLTPSSGQGPTNPSTVNGTKIVHPGSVTSALGGPTKYVAGISGSAVHHKP